MKPKKVLIFVVSYNASKTIREVLSRIPQALFESDRFTCEVLVIDDCSDDDTYQCAKHFASPGLTFPLTIMENPENLGYGGNQKVGYRYALDNGFDIVALLHGDSQYAPEELPNLLEPLLQDKCEAVFGSRMLRRGGAIQGGMPVYKYIGNKILSYLQNILARSNLSEFHSGYRAYSVHALERIPFDLNSSDFDFDTEIILQLLASGARISEIAIPTHYGDEICHVNGLKYAWDIIATSLKYRMQGLGLFYDPKFDLFQDVEHYEPKFDFLSSHQLGLAEVGVSKKVLLLGCGGWALVEPYVKKGAEVYVIDRVLSSEIRSNCAGYWEGDLEAVKLEEVFPSISFDTILAMDIIEHLQKPQCLLDSIRFSPGLWDAHFVITCPNVAFAPVRLMMLLGFFNQGKRGILDITHLRHFTHYSLERFLVQYGFRVIVRKGVPAPFPLALGRDSHLAKFLLFCNALAIKILPGVFSYQTFCVALAVPTPSKLLQRALGHTAELQRVEALDESK